MGKREDIKSMVSRNFLTKYIFPESSGQEWISTTLGRDGFIGKPVNIENAVCKRTPLFQTPNNQYCCKQKVLSFIRC